MRIKLPTFMSRCGRHAKQDGTIPARLHWSFDEQTVTSEQRLAIRTKRPIVRTSNQCGRVSSKQLNQELSHNEQHDISTRRKDFWIGPQPPTQWLETLFSGVRSADRSPPTFRPVGQRCTNHRVIRVPKDTATVFADGSQVHWNATTKLAVAAAADGVMVAR